MGGIAITILKLFHFIPPLLFIYTAPWISGEHAIILYSEEARLEAGRIGAKSMRKRRTR